MNKFNCILFDLDGTLINTYELVTKSFQFTIKNHFDRELTPEEILPFFGEPLWVTMERFSKEDYQELIKTYRQYNLIHHDELTTIYPGVIETLEVLKKQGIPLGVVTSKTRLGADRGFALFNLDRYIDVCIALEDAQNHKPHPEPILKALERLEVKHAGQTLMVGDSPFDIQCARNAGVKSAAVGWSILPKYILLREKPDLIIQNFQDLLDYF